MQLHTGRRYSLKQIFGGKISATFLSTETLRGKKIRDSFGIRNILQEMLGPRPVSAANLRQAKPHSVLVNQIISLGTKFAVTINLVLWKLYTSSDSALYVKWCL
jgi:hypothetical protein